ncbi:MAG: hypothetical protein LR015_13860, partial [Verrucomicrobia bacterium]|nr:hypothetical protein [Verrucomicrobiota bacterium]
MEDVEELADRMYHKELHELNKLEASGLIVSVRQTALDCSWSLRSSIAIVINCDGNGNEFERGSIEIAC